MEWSIHSITFDSHVPPVQAVFGWMAGKGGLLGEEHSIIDDASQDSVAKWEEKYVAPGGEAHPGGEVSGSKILYSGFGLGPSSCCSLTGEVLGGSCRCMIRQPFVS